MEYIIHIFESCFFVVILGEIIVALLIVWGFRHEEKIVQFENKVLRIILKGFPVLMYRLSEWLYIVVRKTFIFFYRPYRQMKKRLLKRLLRQFHLKAVRYEQVNCYEILSGR